MPVSIDPVPSSDPGNPPTPASIDSTAGGQAEAVTSPPGGTSPPVRPGPTMLLLLVAAAISTPLAAVLVQQFGRPFQLPQSVIAGIGVVPRPEEAAKVATARGTRDRRNSCVTFALIGAVLGLCFAIAGGISQSSRRMLVAGSVGASLCSVAWGAIAGAVASLASPSLPASLEAEHKTIVAEALGWAIVGIGVGLGAALALRTRRALTNGTLAAFAGGLIGGALYIPVVSLLIPGVDGEQIIPDTFVARLLWIGLPAIGMAFGMGRALVRNAVR